MMQILAQINKTYTIDVANNDTIADIKRKIEDQSAICHSKQTLVFNGKKLQNNIKLTDYHIPNLSVVNVLLLPINVSNEVKIKLVIDLSDILPFGNCKASHIIDCDHSITMKTIINDLDLNYISHMLQLIFYYGDKNKKQICFKYSQIENKTIFDIKNIIFTQYAPKKYKNAFEVKLFLNFDIASFSLPTKIIIQSQFISKFSEYINEKKSREEYNQLEINIMMQLVSIICTLKSGDTLLYEIVACLTKCFKYGIPQQVDSMFSKCIIPTIVNVLSYSKCEKLTAVLSECLLKIKTYDKILDGLNTLCDPCSTVNSLNNISKVYCKLAEIRACGDKLFEQLYTLVFYEDDEDVLINILSSYHKYIILHPNISDNIMSDEFVVTTKEKYGRKREQNALLFGGFIRELLIHIQMGYIPNDLFMLIFSYYNGYYGDNIQPNMVGRVIDLFNKNNNGYCKEISKKALWIAKKAIQPLVNVDSIICGSMLVNTFWDNGFVNGLFILMEHFKNGSDDDDYNVAGTCEECGNDSMGLTHSDTDIFYCMDCWGKFTLMRILEVMEFLIQHDWTKELCLKQIECLNENKCWEETQQCAKLWKDKNNNK